MTCSMTLCCKYSFMIGNLKLKKNATLNIFDNNDERDLLINAWKKGGGGGGGFDSALNTRPFSLPCKSSYVHSQSDCRKLSQVKPHKNRVHENPIWKTY